MHVLPLAPTRRRRALRAHRRLRLAIAGLSFTALPALWAAWLVAPGATAPVAVLLAWLAAWLALVVWLARFRCPSCEKRAHWGPLFDLFTTRCVHCGGSLDPREAQAQARG